MLQITSSARAAACTSVPYTYSQLGMLLFEVKYERHYSVRLL